MSTGRPKRNLSAPKDVPAEEPVSRSKKSKAFTAFDATVKKHAQENEYLLGRFLDDRNYVVLDPKVDGKIFPAPHMGSKGMAAFYEYPLQPGIQFLAEFPVDKQRYLAELVVVTKSLAEATSREKYLKQLQQISAKSEQARITKDLKDPKAKTTENLLASTETRSPRTSRPLGLSQDSVSSDETPATRNDDVVVVPPPLLLVESSRDDSQKSLSVRRQETGTKSAPILLDDSVKQRPNLLRARFNGISKEDDTAGTSSRTAAPQHTATGAGRKETSSVEKVLRYRYEIPQFDGIPKVLLVPKYPGIRVYIDEATLTYYRKVQNRTTPGQLVSAMLDALAGGEDGVTKVYRTYLEKLALTVGFTGAGAEARTFLGNTVSGFDKDLAVKVENVFLDGEGYSTLTGAWVSNAMNRWKKRQFVRFGFIRDEDEQDADDNEEGLEG